MSMKAGVIYLHSTSLSIPFFACNMNQMCVLDAFSVNVFFLFFSFFLSVTTACVEQRQEVDPSLGLIAPYLRRGL
jgi:hypothetical protein